MDTQQLLILVGTFVGTGGFAALFSLRAKNDLINVQASHEAVDSLRNSLAHANVELIALRVSITSLFSDLEEQRCKTELWKDRAHQLGWADQSEKGL